MDKPSSNQIVNAETNHLRLVQRNGWSYAQRTNHVRVVCVIAVTDDRCLILVEQFREPVGQRVIELPAGLAGDLTDQADESLQRAAARELLEETGFVAREWRQIARLPSSAGLTDEVVNVFLATDLERKTAGGGAGSERIVGHAIPLADIDDWLARAAEDDKLVDARVYAALYFLDRRFPMNA